MHRPSVVVYSLTTVGEGKPILNAKSKSASLLRLTIVLAAAVAPACKKSSTAKTELLVSVSSVTSVDRLDFIVRNLELESDHLSVPLEGRDLGASPYELLLQPSGHLSSKLFIAVKGYRDDVLVAGLVRYVDFANGKRVEVPVSLLSGFADSDGDGFPAWGSVPACTADTCDCDDARADISPFRIEVCEDPADNNCHGGGNWDGCDCSESDPPVPCTNLSPSQYPLSGVGACSIGYLRCVPDPVTGVRAMQTACSSGAPKDETAGNFVDDDCDGVVDEGSECTTGAMRRCRLGFVDDPANPNAEERDGATRRLLGDCAVPPADWPVTTPFPVQRCISGTWSSVCEGDIIPQRGPPLVVGTVGFYFAELPNQCDGRDNDCNGLYDENQGFDADGDGYTVCGTTFAASPTDPLVNTHTSPGASPDYADCDDKDPNVHPGQAEICGNSVDEDCRCDHDDPSTQVDDVGQPLCKQTYGALDCSLLPRSDQHPAGNCRDAPTYYRGFSNDSSGRQSCYVCDSAFGKNCNGSTGTCTSKEDDCAGCPFAHALADGDIDERRPMCRVGRPGTCNGTTPAAWDLIQAGTDPFDDCGSASCAGYYWGIDTDRRCYEYNDVPSSAVTCNGAATCDDTAASCCQTAEGLCPQQTTHRTLPVPMPVCTKIVSGCVSGSTSAPVTTAQAPGDDIYGDCLQAYPCNQPEGGGPFYLAIEGAPPECFFKDDVSDAACNGASQCQTQQQACLAVLTGSRAVDHPQRCVTPTGGCSASAAPSFGPVTHKTDPYGECGGRGCCSAGACCATAGETCTADSDCLTDHCACTDAGCTARRCSPVPCPCGFNGDSDTICDGSLLAGLRDPANSCGATACDGARQCRLALGSTCAADFRCESGQCECASSDCVTQVCSPTTCSCGWGAGGSCTQALIDFTMDPGDCDDVTLPPSTCVAGACKRQDGYACTANTDCANTCIALVCAPRAGLLGACDNPDPTSDCQAGLTCSAGACRLPDFAQCASNAECVNTCIGGTCTPRASAGGTCDTADATDCQTALSTCPSGRCLAPNGATCAANDQCQQTCIATKCATRSGVSGACDVGDQAADCSISGAACPAGRCLSPPGAACRLAGDCAVASSTCPVGFCLSPDTTACAANNECQHTCINHQCSAASGYGGACDTGDAAKDCSIAGSTCSAALTCQSPPGAGCADPVDCAVGGSTCVGAVCRAPTGTACTANAQCQGSCIGGLCAARSDPGGACDAGDALADCTVAGSTCSAAFKCLSPSGGACGTALDCAVGSSTCPGGVCLAPEGAGCTTNQNGWCQGTCIANRCAPLAAPGGTCDVGDAASDCAVAGSTCPGGACLAPAGTDCTANHNGWCQGTCIANQCATLSAGGGTCDAGDTADCATALSTCPAGTCLSPDGQDCVLNTDCQGTCIGTAPGPRQCAPTSSHGGPCDTGDANDCSIASSSCPSGSCLSPPGGACGTAATDCAVAGSSCPATGPAAGTCLSPGGGACATAADCATDLSTCLGGTCRSPNGTPCTQNTDCQMTCVGSGQDRLCAVPSSYGGSCDTGDADDCSIAGSSCPSGSCLSPPGGACGADADCAAGSCPGGTCLSAPGGACGTAADCMVASSTCPSGVCLSPDGETCVANTECQGTCIGTAPTRQCAARSSYGGPCDAGDGPNDCSIANSSCPSGSCQSPSGGACGNAAHCAILGSSCTGLTCRAPNGQSCEPNHNDWCQNTCLGGTCANKSAPGGTCDQDDNNDCTSGSCTGTNCN